jgi:hypothetical protein
MNTLEALCGIAHATLLQDVQCDGTPAQAGYPMHVMVDETNVHRRISV